MTDFNPEKHYMGAPCKRGHDGVRYIAFNRCVACEIARVAKRRALDPEKQKERCAAYYQRNGDKVRQQARERRERNLEHARERVREYHKANPEKVAAYGRKYRQTNPEKVAAKHRKYREANPEKIAAYARQYHQANLAKYAAKRRKRTAQKLKATPAWLTADDHWLIQEIYDLCAERTRVTGVEHHVDHIVPLQGRNVRGLHVPWNLQILAATENRSKGNRFVDCDNRSATILQRPYQGVSLPA